MIRLVAQVLDPGQLARLHLRRDLLQDALAFDDALTYLLYSCLQCQRARTRTEPLPVS